MPCLIKLHVKVIRISQIFIIYYDFSVDFFAQDTHGGAGDGPIDGLKFTGRLDDFGGNRVVGHHGRRRYRVRTKVGAARSIFIT
jgi:hypothetical protein